jgi:branched-chain amino acid transport system ATP-binding protein
MPTILSVQNVSKHFGELLAVNDISFDVSEGEIFGIAGPNGAGKTTLFNLITGIPFHGNSGQIEFAGRRIERLAPDEIFRAGIARTFQKETAFDTLTVQENVRIGAVFGGIRGREAISQAVTKALQYLDLESEQERVASELPLYSKKRLMIASAIVSNPTLLMLDEPAAGLNLIELSQLEKLILSLHDLGVTIVIIEHVLPLLFGISNRVMVMDFGKKIAEGSPKTLATDEIVIEAYLGERGKDAFHAITG